ncbi:unnamed protein product, partial [Laminaria digitata]
QRLQRKPPVPTATATTAHSSSARGANAKSASKSRDTARGAGKCRKPRKKSAERGSEGPLLLDSEADFSDTGGGGGVLYGPDRAHLVQQLREAKKDIESLHRDQAAAAQERVHWQRRDDDLSRAVSELENSRAALERRLRAESDATDAEKGRAKGAEARFERLLAWARVQEERRRKAEEGLRSACEGTQAAKARTKVVEEEARECKRQFDVRRFRLEGALEDLRRRTLENERLEAQATTMRGEGEALRELADARGLESTGLREKLARLVQEAKGMSSENVNIRKQLSSEQERWRAAERSRAKHDERRRIEMERKSDDVHALRYRMQELEARLSSETVRRQGAEEDARRSQEMERRSMEELMEGRKTALPVQAGLSHSLPPRATNPYPGFAEPEPEAAWKSWGDGMRDSATAAATSSGARSSTASETFTSNHLRRGRPSALMGQRRQDRPTRRDDVVIGQDFTTPTTMFPPSAFPPPLPPCASFSRGKPMMAATPVAAWQSIQPQPQSRSPVRVGVRRQGRPRPRQAPRE